MKIRKGDR